MGKIEELIKEKCGGKVEYKYLDEVCDFNRGTTITEKTAIAGNIPVISGGQKPAFYHSESNRKANSITVAGSGAYAGYISYWEQPIYCSDAFTVDIKNYNKLNIKYLYHFLLSKQQYIYSKKTGAGIPHIYGKTISKIKIPVPPLEVQEEIVKILDSFTELTARKKQYEYYRDLILSFDKERYQEEIDKHAKRKASEQASDCHERSKEVNDKQASKQASSLFIGMDN